MWKRDQSRLDGFKDIEILSEKLAREVADMDGAAVDALYSEIRFPNNPAERVQDLACTAAQHYTDNGEPVPEHVRSAIGSAAASRAVEIAALIEPASDAPETALVPVRELVAYGKQRALESGLAKVAGEEQSQVTAYAAALVRHQRTEAFDPEHNPHDRLRQEEYVQHRNQQEYVRKGVAEAERRVREYELEVAEIAARFTDGPPRVPAVLTWSVMGLLALTMSPSLFALVFFRLPNSVIAWAASVAGSLLVGTIISWATAGLVSVRPSSHVERFSILAAALGMCMALGLARTTHSEAGYVFPAGVSLIEISAVLLLESVAWRSRVCYARWGELQESRARAAARLHLARRELAERQLELVELKKRIDLHLQYVETRWVRHNRIEELEEIAVRAVCEGYAAGIAANRMRLQGAGGASTGIPATKSSSKSGTRQPRMPRK